MIIWRLLLVEFFPDATEHLHGLQDFVKAKIPNSSWVDESCLSLMGATEIAVTGSESYEDLIIQAVSDLDASIEYTANILSTLFCVRVRVSGPTSTSFAIILNKHEFSDFSRVAEQHNFLNFANLRPVDAERAFSFISIDRPEIAGLLSGALNAFAAASAFTAYIRLFEAAFALSHNQLRKPLHRFLASGPLNISKAESDDWIALRHAIAHSDRSGNAGFDGDAYPELERIKQAAYDVAFNKKKWKSPDSERESSGCVSSVVEGSEKISVTEGVQCCINLVKSEALGRYPASPKAEYGSFAWRNFFLSNLQDQIMEDCGGIYTSFGLQTKQEFFQNA